MQFEIIMRCYEQPLLAMSGVNPIGSNFPRVSTPNSVPGAPALFGMAV